jgi:hypothetical protein
MVTMSLLDELLGDLAISRWGDYSTVSVDPSDPTRFWSIQMYPSDSANEDVWSTQITELLTAPLQLAISRSGTNVMVSWPSIATGYHLQSATNLVSSVTWSNVTQMPVTNSSQLSVLVPISGNQKFFRLTKP